MTLRERVSEELLPFVQQPAQYIGGEFNQLANTGDWQRAEVRVAIAFPDTYTIGMSHLGSQILYWLCNHLPGVCAERVYTPAPDAERLMRARSIPLFTWDTRQAVAQAHILAVSLQYELTYTNVLNLLDLAGIPLRSEERRDEHPLVVVGGPQADSPEPMAPFVDLVVAGDGEHSLQAVIELYRQMRREGASRWDVIVEAAKRFEWIYAPALYEFDYHADGTICRLRASSRCPSDWSPRIEITRCQTPDFESVPYPTRPLVPYVEVVHDRISIEVMRGCPQRCRFCHAGYTKRPLRWRSVDRILDIAEQAWAATGQEEIGLLSLSTADYPRLAELTSRINERFAQRHVNISVPSLRVDQMLTTIPHMINSVRKGSVTIAPEAARSEMRGAILKKVSDVNLMEGLKQIYAAGWNAVKLYFMCGFPGEQEQDITGIFDLAYQVSQAKRQVRGGPAAVTASVSWLVPKPHTPMQWVPQQTADYFHHARRLLRDAASRVRSAVRIKTHPVEASILEGVLSRGDRRVAGVIETAYRLGARLDGWTEHFNHAIWLTAFERNGLDPAFYTHRERGADEILPWQHFRTGRGHDYLRTQNDDMHVRLKTVQAAG